MFANVSMTATGMVTLLLSWLLAGLGVEVGEESIAGFVQAVLTAVGFVWMVWGQLRRDDLSYGIFRN
jgi:hypothetical protein